MYENLFDNEKQSDMRNYFLSLAQSIGIIKHYKKNEIINCNADNFVGIVMKGVLYQNIISSKGQVHSLYTIIRC